MTIPGWLWIAWVVLGAVSFAVAEGLAIANKVKGDTLSENVRQWFRTTTKAGRWVWVVVWSVFAAWFAVHIAAPGSM